MSMAARLGDPTAHGGVIMVGFPTVLIGNMPAARVGDNHVCPMVTPGVPPIPHVGGPITMGSPTVLIGNMPAARMGDMLVCVGPPDTIMMGCPTVMIGMGGGGAGAAGSASPSAAAAAYASAQAAQFDNVEATVQEEPWIRFELKDKAGYPVSGQPYRFKDPDGKEMTSRLRQDGVVQRTALEKEGQGEVTLMSVSEASWSDVEAKVGEALDLSAKVDGFKDGTRAVLQVWKRDLSGPDVLVDELDSSVRGGKVEGQWAYALPEDFEVTSDFDAYTMPQYYFDVVVETCRTRSGMLTYKDYVEIECVSHNAADDRTTPLSEPYVLYLSNGEVRQGTLSQGKAREENIPPGRCAVVFPTLEDYDQDAD